MPAKLSKLLRLRLSRVRLLLCDVDGVLTDGTVCVGDNTEFKSFNVRDGLGLVLLRGAHIKVGWVSSRPSPATTQRAKELQIDYLLQQKGSKATIIESLLERISLTWEETAYIGDDILDLGALKRAGVAVAVADASPEAKAAAAYVTWAAGGRGAVREVVEMILKAQGQWQNIVTRHAG